MKAPLRFAHKEDIVQLLKWSLSPDYLFYFGSLNPGTLASQKEEWIRRIDLNQLAFGPRQTLMVTNDQQTVIGFITLANIDWRNRHCAFEIYFDDKARSQNLAMETTAHAFQYVFEQLGLQKIYSYVLSENKPALAMQKAVDQKPEAVFNKQFLLNGKYYDVQLFGYHRDEMKKEIEKRIA
jgi:RimJ/RimL family protein N-acetyltransferase